MSTEAIDRRQPMERLPISGAIFDSARHRLTTIQHSPLAVKLRGINSQVSETPIGTIDRAIGTAASAAKQFIAERPQVAREVFSEVAVMPPDLRMLVETAPKKDPVVFIVTPHIPASAPAEKTSRIGLEVITGVAS